MQPDDNRATESGSLPHGKESSHHRTFGISRVSHEEFRFLYAAEHVYVAGLFLHGLFLFVFFWLNIHELYLFNVFSLVVFLLALYLNRNDHYYLALWLTYIEVVSHASLAIFLVGWSSGFYYYMFAISPLLFIKPTRPLAEKILLSAVPVGLMIVFYVDPLNMFPVYHLDVHVTRLLHIGNLVATVALVAYLAHYYSKGVNDSERQLQRLTEAYEELATYDSLTRLLNRHAMIQAIKEEVSRFQRDKKPFVLALGDIDDFKNINDRFGHHAGDVLLKEFASRMQQRLRRHDVVSRWGGEEFLIMLANVTLEEAEAVLSDLRDCLAEPMRINSLVHQVTITFGACQYSDELGVDKTIQFADNAMYQGKHDGKNRVVLAKGVQE
ncbi:GGDEF domain-containing protein [Thiohalophilus thiocyanatoxydans]|uniref:diguanylate cyclase n=1 Tax=Thiohalophilus thiocyanatoxydans TaxID=381308 RepID=A0A4R8IXB6_9GAMM|nr:GGDEF domain-containing protein [Thiohalophilus thiocyanatoxydans]TDY02517.1 diguanylate cyclase (GGDEF)-like protein [Thiohalophilus thiocyanatoxydans]